LTDILVVDTSRLTHTHDYMEAIIQHAEWRPREEIELDERWRQVIPYTIFTTPNSFVFSYCRKGGDERLNEKMSFGVGGHIERCDKEVTVYDTILNAARREIDEEVNVKSPLNLVYRGIIYDHSDSIGRTHIGVVFNATGFEEMRTKDLSFCDFYDPTSVDMSYLETWSQIIIRRGWW